MIDGGEKIRGDFALRFFQFGARDPDIFRVERQAIEALGIGKKRGIAAAAHFFDDARGDALRFAAGIAARSQHFFLHGRRERNDAHDLRLGWARHQ